MQEDETAFGCEKSGVPGGSLCSLRLEHSWIQTQLDCAWRSEGCQRRKQQSPLSHGHLLLCPFPSGHSTRELLEASGSSAMSLCSGSLGDSNSPKEVQGRSLSCCLGAWGAGSCPLQESPLSPSVHFSLLFMSISTDKIFWTNASLSPFYVTVAPDLEAWWNSSVQGPYLEQT